MALELTPPRGNTPNADKLIDFPVSWDVWRHYCKYFDNFDPGPNEPEGGILNGKGRQDREQLPLPVRERASHDRGLTTPPRKGQLPPGRGADKEPRTGLPKAPPPSSIQLLIDTGSQGTG